MDETAWFKLEKRGRTYGKLSKVFVVWTEGRNPENKASGALKANYKIKSAALWWKSNEGEQSIEHEHKWKVREHRATHGNKWKQERMKIVVRMIMWVNKRWWRRQKHQYFGQFKVKELMKVGGNIWEWSGTQWLHSATSGNKNEWKRTMGWHSTWTMGL